ncbi:14546_t:CDS:2 [Acaulospora morrowiae]|uniref:RNA helicase n=1 Tax=Acaulospora morrowiae TaxID=94023 RepID=A0A9N9CY94_9GLOM|nr:14546_t:CDS:2 [Acaulospora morrowiae]
MTGNSEIFKLLGQKSPYKRKRRVRFDFMKNRRKVNGSHDGFQSPEYEIPLPKFKIPQNLKRIFVKSEPDALLTSELKDLRLDSINYENFFNTLLFAEEYQMINDIMLYDQEGVEMKKRDRFFILHVPGLAEKRPSVIVGDHVFVVKCGEDEREKAYQGFIHHVEEMSITIKFPKVFSSVYSSNTRFNVRYTFNRLPMRRMHNALKCADIIERLFPSNEARTHCNIDKIMQKNSFETINKTIENNIYQMRAVVLIKQELYHPAPFIVFGPPGTGKSVTIVEAMKQLLNEEKGNVKILVCAPSNSAADILLKKLSTTLLPDKVARINAACRDIENVYTDEGLRRYCKDLDLKSFENHKIIVSTCATAGSIHALGGGKRYTHIFIDEAGQAMEPEVMTALQNASKETKIILAGDPRQLGPIVNSSIAKRLGLGKSLIERLVNMENGPYDFSETCNYGVKLRMNYRSHQEILRVPNELFYENELKACGDKSITHSLVNSSALHKKNYPIKFVSVYGQDLREGHSPSWFNIEEAAEILKIVQELVEKDNVRKEDIGIITPYCKQVEKIKTLMEDNNFEGLDIGTVENFQGRERLVIIISTVRSTPKNLEHDGKFRLGFLNEPKRFCVAVTRARAFMAVVGNPNLLFSDEYWKRWLKEVNIRGGYVGEPFPKETDDGEEQQ